MKPTRKTWLALLAVGSALVTWGLLTLLRTTHSVPMLASWPVCAVLLVVAGFVFSVGWPVRQYLKGKTKRIDALRAARAAALGKTAALGGAILTGFYGAQALVAYQAPQPMLHGQLWVGLAATGCALVVAVIGLIVEGFCKLPPPSDSEPRTDSDTQPA